MLHGTRLASVVLLVTFCGASAGNVSAQDSATIKGKVIFKGDPDKYKPRPLEVPTDAGCSPSGQLLSESVILNLDTKPVTIRNVVVSIKEGPVDKRRRWLQQPKVMAGENCRFEPHVVALLDRMQIYLDTQDPVPHNFHFMAKVNREHNFTIPRKGMQMSVVMDAEDPIEIKSDRYPWMSAWVVVLDHPYFLITEAAGTFVFEGVPAGEYVLEAWHETFGKQTITVEAKEGETKEADFVFEPDKK